MAVTSQGAGRGKPKTRTGTMKRKSTVKRRNAPAAALADPRYRKRVVKSAKAYKRKDRTKVVEDDDA
jgi:stalled ribosome alternative rescue factor ArfA